MRIQNKILEPRYVLSFIIRFFFIVFMGFGVFALALTGFLGKRIGPAYSESIFFLSRLQEHLPLILFVTAFVQAVILSAVMLFFVLLWLHSVSGPIVRFKRCLKDISEGKILKGSISFREKDQLQGIAYALSGMISSHREKDALALGLMVEAQKLIDEYAALKKEGKAEGQDMDLKINKLHSVYNEIKNIYAPKRE